MKDYLYAVYQGTRYEAKKISSRKYRLTARGTDCPDGFLSLSSRSRAFYKNAIAEELDAVYRLESIAVYEGCHLRIVDVDPDGVTVSAGHAALSALSTDEGGDGLCYLARETLTRVIDYMTFYEASFSPAEEPKTEESATGLPQSVLPD